MKRGPDRGYFPEPAKSLFISDTPGKEEVAKQEFAVEGLTPNFVSGNRHLGAYLGLQAELEAWVKTQVEAWPHRVRVPGVGTLMGPIEEALREKFSPSLFWGE